MQEKGRVISYSPSITCEMFHNARGYEYRGIRGPVGSGKSVACCMEIFRCANEQVPCYGGKLSGGVLPKGCTGVRSSRWLVGRNTFTDLQRTTVETWMHWFPKTVMHWSSPMSGILEAPSIHEDGTWISLELLFYALDTPTIMDDLYALELSGAWIDEATQTPWKVIHQAFTRIGRYQPYQGSPMLNSYGVIMCTNPTNEGNWWHHKEVEEKPKGMAFFVQPPVFLRRFDRSTGEVWYEDNKGQDEAFPAAENVGNIKGGFSYWRNMLIGASEDSVKRLLLNQWGTTSDGMPVYPEWNDEVNVAKEELSFERGLPLFMGTDFGRTPATIFAQMGSDGQLRVLDELVSENISTEGYIEEMLRPKLVNEYGWPNVRHVNYADPAGNNPDQVVQATCIQTMNRNSIFTLPCPVQQNSFELRRECVSDLLRSSYAGKPAIILSPKCKMLRKGFNGFYHYRKMRTGGAGDDRYAEAADKNEYSHPHDALQYLCYGVVNGGIDVSSMGGTMMGKRAVMGLGSGVDMGGFAL